jgi:hypothetical protein
MGDLGGMDWYMRGSKCWRRDVGVVIGDDTQFVNRAYVLNDYFDVNCTLGRNT